MLKIMSLEVFLLCLVDLIVLYELYSHEKEIKKLKEENDYHHSAGILMCDSIEQLKHRIGELEKEKQEGEER